MFRRRGRARGEQLPPEPAEDDELAEDDDAADDDSEDLAGQQEPAAGPRLPADAASAGPGPFDSRDPYPQQERLDLGSLLIPVREGQEVRLDIADDRVVAATVVLGDSALQVQAFAAPKTGALWEEVREQLTGEISRLGGEWQQAQGRFGTEILASIPAEPLAAGPQPARFLGVDGPRWLLRGTITGAAAHEEAGAGRGELAAPLEEVFAGIVVVRGQHPAPPRDMLEIRLPEEMRQAIEQEIAEAEQRREYPSPFERGPEITETR